MKEVDTVRATQAAVQSVKSTWRAAPHDQQRPVAISAECLAKEKLLDEALNKYCELLDEGTAPPPKQFSEQYPNYRHSLCRLLDVELAMAGEPELEDALEEAWPKPMQSFLGYEIIHELGIGAFARVYLAAETALGGRLVAIKVSPYASDEAETLAKLTHPNIVPIFSVQQEKETEMTAVCMPYRGSTTLADLLESGFTEGRPPASARVITQVPQDREPVVGFVERALKENKIDPILKRGRYVDGIVRLGIQMAEALAYTHERGILHRDLKLSNVLLTPAGIPMLLDFNLASDIESGARRLGGTLPYMPPEQIRDAHLRPLQSDNPGDPRSDIFSLGVILYELLTGKLPFGDPPASMSPSEAATEYMKLQERKPTPIAKLNPQVSPALAKTIDRCLSLDIEKRPKSAADLAKRLRRQFGWGAWLNRYRVLFLVLVAVAMLAAANRIRASLDRVPDYERHMEAAVTALEAEDFENAIRYFDKAEEAEGRETVSILFGRGYASQHAGKLRTALDEFKKACKLTSNPLVTDCYAYTAAVGGERHSAIGHYQRPLQHRGVDNPDSNTAMRFVSCGYCKFTHNREKPSTAIPYLTKAIEVDPKLQIAFHVRAELKLESLDPERRPIEDAIADIEDAVRLGSGYGELHCDAARIYAVAAINDSAYLTKVKEHLRGALMLGMSPIYLKARVELRPWRDESWFVETLDLTRPTSATRPYSLGRRALLERSIPEVTRWLRGTFE
ncbi:MAG: serine/threonine protein kinase [Planctomycetes bacterium]|nr:serine/threonine protein kinase [Planctomycetota bacterium]